MDVRIWLRRGVVADRLLFSGFAFEQGNRSVWGHLPIVFVHKILLRAARALSSPHGSLVQTLLIFLRTGGLIPAACIPTLRGAENCQATGLIVALCPETVPE